MKVATLLAHLGKGGSLRAPVKVKVHDTEVGIERVHFRKDGTFIITVKEIDE